MHNPAAGTSAWTRVVAVVLFAALIPVAMAAQETVSGQTAVGRISGTVMNANGKSLAGTTVTLSSDSSDFRRTVVTDKKGSYRFDTVPVDRYTVTAELERFVTVTRPAVVAENDLDVELRFFLGAADPVVTLPKPQRAPRPVIVPFD